MKTVGLNLLALALLLAACSGAKKDDRQVSVTSAAITSNDLEGGVVIQIRNAATNVTQTLNIPTPPFVISLVDGTWDIYLIGTDGSGMKHCGGATGLVLGPTTLDINLNATPGTCSLEPFSTIIANTPALWDQGTWNLSKWAP